jgi:hypothetical protein
MLILFQKIKQLSKSWNEIFNEELTKLFIPKLDFKTKPPGAFYPTNTLLQKRKENELLRNIKKTKSNGK